VWLGTRRSSCSDGASVHSIALMNRTWPSRPLCGRVGGLRSWQDCAVQGGARGTSPFVKREEGERQEEHEEEDGDPLGLKGKRGPGSES
jgi:hypothetical protein